MGELIPLFPLGTPLFPGVVLPLQIFEPRYRRLVRDLTSLPGTSDRRRFGVVAIRQGWEVEKVAPASALYDVGCTARLHTVRPQDDGGFRIVTVGGDRFRLLDVVISDDPPYLQGEVEWLAEEEAAGQAAGDTASIVAPSPGDPFVAEPGAAPDDVSAAVARGAMTVLVRGVRDLFLEYVAEVAGLGVGRDDVEVATMLDAIADDAAALSWLVASTALLTTEDRQELLAESATRRRLITESRLLRRELTLLQELGAIPAPLQQFASPMTVN
jgi:ATP-dependent Lon protease